MIGGQSRYDWGDGIPIRERPGINPDRHARIRARHFHHASGHAWTCSVTSALDYDAFSRFFDLSLMYDRAFTCCAWGVS